MEMLPSSGVQYVGESDHSQQNSGTVFIYAGESNSDEHGKQVHMVDGGVNILSLNGEGSQIHRQSDGQGAANGLPLSEGHQCGPSYSDCQVESQKLSGDSHDFEDEDLNVQNSCTKPCEAPENFQVIVDTIESEPTNGRDEESSLSEPKWLEHGESVALWVKDLNVARRFIMQKLAVGMLNIVDQFHTEALIDTARDVMVWKEFAMEASHCSGYSDLGRMLLKLQNMILQQYVKSDWLEHSFQSWVQRCQVVQSAESIELLREELSDSILWNEVNSLWNAPVQPTLGSEWKTWKHEVMKWFSTSHPVSSSGDVEKRSCDSPSTMSLQVGRKRPKLEVRRAESHASQVETSSPLQTMTVEIDSEFFNNRDIINAATVTSGLPKEEYFREGAAPTESPCSVTDKWEKIVVEAGNSELMQTKDIERTPINEVLDKKTIDAGNKNRQCIAFIESKGRQCVRWANDGDVYCCVHLATRFIGSSTRAEASPPVNSPMCEGTTVLGTRCKHRSLPGSSFCKNTDPGLIQ
ncbi:hypothetical protein GH714_031540 [Hevea brasiliensis]|uniref:Uncharacterized protein n=1 Tax=Hevea brasiliensis TaxID=3981 RepID=A0A6A6L495_HEVBR|nr:hypothetical protein GH714_031540 [Hevea brasiliensis]